MELLSTKWNEADIEIQASFIPKRLWLAATIDVLLNKEKILATDGQLKLHGEYEKQFEYSNQNHMAKLEWSRFWLHTVPCTLYIDDQKILQGKANIRNWQLNIVALIFYTIFLIVFFFGLTILGLIVIEMIRAV